MILSSRAGSGHSGRRQGHCSPGPGEVRGSLRRRRLLPRGRSCLIHDVGAQAYAVQFRLQHAVHRQDFASAAADFLKYSPAYQAGFIKGMVSTLETCGHLEADCLVHYFNGHDQHGRQDYLVSLELNAPNYMETHKAPVYLISGAHNYCVYPGNAEDMQAASTGC